MPNILEKYKQLQELFKSYGSVVVAFSGGVDSALVLKVACDLLGDKVLAVTSDSASVPRQALAEAERLAQEFGARHLIIKTEEMQKETYLKNPVNRCYFCKSTLYGRLSEIAGEYGFSYIANGTNRDDLGDYRPGLGAASEFRVVSPLCEAAMGKDEVRRLARHLNIEVWDKPANPCLSSRIPYGSRVSERKLGMIEAGESFLHARGFRIVRVRHFGVRARIEVPRADLDRLRKDLPEIQDSFAHIGFEATETAEFRSGALNVLAGVSE